MHFKHTLGIKRNFNDKHYNKKGLRQSIERVNLRKRASEHKQIEPVPYTY